MANTEGETTIVIKKIKEGKKPSRPSNTLPSFPSLLLKYTGRIGISTEKMAELAGFSRAYGFSIMTGKKVPEADKIICIAFVLRLDEKETQLLLKSAGRATLSGMRERDTFILYGLIKKISLGDMNDMLVQNGQKPLY